MRKEAEAPGKLIVVEGIDGSGKTTQTHLLANMLEQHNYSVFLTREPGGGSMEARQALFELPHDAPETPYQELVLIEIDRALHSQKIEDHLKRGVMVVSDRGPTSTLAFQGTRGVDPEFIRLVNRLATSGRSADLTILCDLDPEIAQHRLSSRGGEITRFDTEIPRSHRERRSIYLREYERHTDTWHIIDASKSEKEIALEVEKVVRRRLRLRI